MTTQQAERFEYRHPLMVADFAICSRPELEYMEAMAENYAEGYARPGCGQNIGRAEEFERALVEIRRRLEESA